MKITFLDAPFDNMVYGSSVGKADKLAWPVNVYRVTLPKRGSRDLELNPFERVILQLLSTGLYAIAGQSSANLNSDYTLEQDLEDATCINRDLIHSILMRLQDNGYLTENNVVTEQTNAYFRDLEQNVEYVSALAFRELAGGRVLPYIQLVDSAHPFSKVMEEDRGIRKIPKSNEFNNVPQVKEIYNALRIMARRSWIYRHEKISVPSESKIIISSNPETLYLNCTISIQKTDGQFRITDPFGYGFSIELEQVFAEVLEKEQQLLEQADPNSSKGKRNLYQWYHEWASKMSDASKQSQRQKEPYENSDCMRLYPELVHHLQHGLDVSRTLTQIYSAIEWAFYYFCNDSDELNQALMELKLMPPKTIAPSVLKIAQDLGFRLKQFPYEYHSNGKFASFQNNSPEMGTVLAVSLFESTYDPVIRDKWRQILSHWSGFFKQISSLKERRNKQAHGDEASNNQIEHPENAFMEELVHFLLPTVSFSEQEPQINNDAFALNQIGARKGIQDFFGMSLFNSMHPDIKSMLVDAERYYQSEDDNKASNFVCKCSGIIERLLKDKYSLMLLEESVVDSEIETKAKQKAAASGLGRLPRLIANTKSIYVKLFIQGRGGSLGAGLLSFLIAADDDILSDIAARQSSFLNDVNAIINKRQHCNTKLSLTDKELEAVRQQAYQTIETLLEVLTYGSFME